MPARDRFDGDRSRSGHGGRSGGAGRPRNDGTGSGQGRSGGSGRPARDGAGSGASRSDGSVRFNGRRYVGGTADARNVRDRNARDRNDRDRTDRDRNSRDRNSRDQTVDRRAGERDASGAPLEGTPERPHIPEWDETAPASGAGHSLPTEPEGERLQKVLAAAGVASRRVAEHLIVEGRVTVNGEIADELGRRVDAEHDEIAVDGVAVQLDQSRRYVVLNKPTGVVSSMQDEKGRPDLSQFADKFGERLFNVGRLDGATSGLLILTNDGALAHVLAHPSFGVTKTYVAKVEGGMTASTVQQLLDGVDLEDGPIAADKVRLLETSRGSSLVEITLHSGRNRIVRRMLDEVGHPVQALVRRSFGPVQLGSLGVGQMREMTRQELGALLTIARGAAARS
jgi:pseudouridine synthase